MTVGAFEWLFGHASVVLVWMVLPMAYFFLVLSSQTYPDMAIFIDTAKKFKSSAATKVQFNAFCFGGFFFSPAGGWGQTSGLHSHFWLLSLIGCRSPSSQSPLRGNSVGSTCLWPCDPGDSPKQSQLFWRQALHQLFICSVFFTVIYFHHFHSWKFHIWNVLDNNPIPRNKTLKHTITRWVFFLAFISKRFLNDFVVYFFFCFLSAYQRVFFLWMNWVFALFNHVLLFMHLFFVIVSSPHIH